jgi:adenylate cyclase, class 2
MKEIEIKAKLRDRAQVMAKLESLGCVFEKIMTQNDVVYVRNVGSLETFLANSAFLRIRTKNTTKILFTVKKPVTNNLDAIEHEVEVNSAGELEQALLLMGYQEAVRINKTRITTTYNGCEICIDEVENLGSFIEMEKLTPEGDAEKIQSELFEFFKTLGITDEDRVFNGYDILMLKNKK